MQNIFQSYLIVLLMQVFKYFLEFLKVDYTTRKNLFDAIINEINILDLILVT